MTNSEKLHASLSQAIAALAGFIETRGRGNELLAIAFVTTDSVNLMSAAVLFEGDLPDDAPAYKRLSPVEWPQSHEAAFQSLNQELARMSAAPGESDTEYAKRVGLIAEACAVEVERARLHERFPRLSFLSFQGVDPNSVLEEAEREFVRRLNPSVVFQEWERELG